MLAPVATDLLLIGIFVIIVGWVYGAFRRRVFSCALSTADIGTCGGRLGPVCIPRQILSAT